MKATLLAMACGLTLLAGCARHSSSAVRRADDEQLAGRPAAGQPTFDSDEAAARALVDAVKADNHDKVHQLLGPNWRDLVSGDKVEDDAAFHKFAQRAGEKMRVDKRSDGVSILHVGNDDWALPIPFTRAPNGKWFLDTEAGKNEILAHRIGRNELQAIKVCQLYVEAQRDYFKERHECAQRISSHDGKRDGLYWDGEGGQSSRFAKLVTDAKLQGYSHGPGRHAPFFGYRFRTLTSQGSNAQGGDMNYVSGGKMTRGFGLVAYPVEYGASGIMTFVVDKDGTVYQKDLGPQTVDIARTITAYNPDKSWALAKE